MKLSSIIWQTERERKRDPNGIKRVIFLLRLRCSHLHDDVVVATVRIVQEVAKSPAKVQENIYLCLCFDRLRMNFEHCEKKA